MPLFAIDKPLALTSHDVVARARRLLGTRRVGHGGTLDPLATGVLLVMSEEETKLSPFLTGSTKGYLAWVSFGLESATLDAEGPALERSESAVERAAALLAEQVAARLPPFLSLREQRPPAFSAIKVQGVKGYQAARRGEPLDLPARAAGYQTLELLAFGPLRELPQRAAEVGFGGVAASDALPEALDPWAPTALIHLDVAAGTYVRAFARDLGAALGVPAHLAGLRRVRSGSVELARAGALEEIATLEPLDPVAVLPFPKLQLGAKEVARVRNGQRFDLGIAERSVLVDEQGALVALVDPPATPTGGYRSVRVWRGSPAHSG
jgi:tRNA pseudouridine55 synthase